MLTPIVELDPGADNEVLDRSRHKDLIGSGDGRDPCSDMDGESSHVVADTLDLAGVQPGAHLESKGA